MIETLVNRKTYQDKYGSLKDSWQRKMIGTHAKWALDRQADLFNEPLHLGDRKMNCKSQYRVQIPNEQI